MLTSKQIGSVVRSTVLILTGLIFFGRGIVFAKTANKPEADAVLAIKAVQTESQDVDFVNAKARPLPLNKKYSAKKLRQDLNASLAKNGSLPETVRVSRSSVGDGITLEAPLNVGVPSAKTAVQPEDSGTANLPYSTARADLDPSPTNTQWPYRAAGKLFFKSVKTHLFARPP